MARAGERPRPRLVLRATWWEHWAHPIWVLLTVDASAGTWAAVTLAEWGHRLEWPVVGPGSHAARAALIVAGALLVLGLLRGSMLCARGSVLLISPYGCATRWRGRWTRRRWRHVRGIALTDADLPPIAPEPGGDLPVPMRRALAEWLPTDGGSGDGAAPESLPRGVRLLAACSVAHPFLLAGYVQLVGWDVVAFAWGMVVLMPGMLALQALGWWLREWATRPVGAPPERRRLWRRPDPLVARVAIVPYAALSEVRRPRPGYSLRLDVEHIASERALGLLLRRDLCIGSIEGAPAVSAMLWSACWLAVHMAACPRLPVPWAAALGHGAIVVAACAGIGPYARRVRSRLEAVVRASRQTSTPEGWARMVLGLAPRGPAG